MSTSDYKAVELTEKSELFGSGGNSNGEESKSSSSSSIGNAKPKNAVTLDCLYGFINLVILAPVAVSFTSIIFSHPIFAKILPSLTKLVLFSSACHQIAFSMFSTLPFAIGQVQDAGLIFLSAMAFTMVESMLEEGKTEDEIVSTVVVVLSVSTFLLGIVLIIVGKLRLAVIVQYIPVPVIGGYLAFIGFFCGKAGITMMTGLESSGFEMIYEMFDSTKMIMLWLPGVILGIGMYLSLRNFQSPYVLPIYMGFMLLLFYGLLFFNGLSLEDAREAELISSLSEAQPFYESWKYYDLSLVSWKQLPTQFFRWVGMFIVVAFSSSLDVAAIEMELGVPLDYNKELQTVGISNCFSGFLGGFTGSYIFSQTIFTMRRNVQSRISGWTVVIGELIIITFPFSITSYIPKLFFGSFLTLIAVDLMYEWLITARKKIMGIEFAVCWLTFISIQFTGVEGGLVLGILFSMVGFVVGYAKSTTVVPRFISSKVVRTFKERAILIENRAKLVTLSLEGHIFFGSAMKILEDVKSRVIFQEEEDSESSESSQKKINKSKTSDGKSSHVPVAAQDIIDENNSIYASADAETGLRSRITYSPSKSQKRPVLKKTFSFVGRDSGSSYGAVDDNDSDLFNENNKSKEVIASTEYLVLDFASVFGVDATAARSCFLMLVQLMRTANVVVVFTGLSTHIEDILRVNDVITSEDIVIPLLDDALEWCEERMLLKHNSNTSSKENIVEGRGQLRDPSYYASASNRRLKSIDNLNNLNTRDSLLSMSKGGDNEVLQHVGALRHILEDYLGVVNDRDNVKHSLSSSVLAKYFDRNVVNDGAVVFDIRQSADYVYFLEDGEIELVKINRTVAESDGKNSEIIERANKINTGGIFGEAEFFLNALHSVRALAVRHSTFWTLSHANFRLMELENPQLCLLIQHLLIKSLCVGSTTVNVV